MKRTWILLHSVGVLAAAFLPLRGAEVLQDIAFGSCIRGVDHPMLERVLTLPMDLFLMMGDNIYADTEDMVVMRSKYDALKVRAAVSSSPKTGGLKTTARFRKKRRWFSGPPA